MAERVYSVVFGGVAVTAIQDLFELTPAGDKPVRLLGMTLAQTTDVGDAAEEILRYQIIRGHSTGGSGGSAPTPRPMDRSGAAAGCATEVNNTTIASAGTGVTLLEDAFNIRAGLQLWFPPECCPTASQGDGTIVVRLTAAPADSITLSGTLFFAEQG